MASSFEASLPDNRSGINRDPKAALPRPRLIRDRNFLLFRFNPCSNSSFSIMFWLLFLLGYIKQPPHALGRLFRVFSSLSLEILQRKVLSWHLQDSTRTSLARLHSMPLRWIVPLRREIGRQSV